jgi:hypothetical protein
MNTEKTFNWVMTTAVLLVLAIPVGIANIYLGYIVGESPCTLCWFERIGMIVIGILGIFMLRYGPKIKYIASVFLFGAYGLYMGLRHTSTHWARDIGMGNGDKLFGAHTYTWAIVVYWIVIVFMAAMLFFLTHRSELMAQLSDAKLKVKKFSLYAKVVVIASFLVVCSNAFQALILNGVPPYTGKGNPDRFSLDLSMMKRTWTAGVWDRLGHWNFTGKNVIENPFIKDHSEPADVDLNKPFSAGALESAKKLTATGRTEIKLPELAARTKAPIMSVARNEKTQELAFITDELGAFYTDPKAQKVNGFVVFDKPNANDMKYVAGSAFAGDKLMIIAFNKVLIGVQKTDKPIDDLLEWRTFRETSGHIAPTFGKNRKNMVSIRGKSSYINSMASDGAYLYTVTIPNRWTKKVVLQKFDTKDWMLSAETLVKASPSLALKKGRTLDDYYVSGLTFHDGKLLALSPRYNTLLVIDPQTAQVVDAFEIEGLASPRSIFVRDGILNVLDRKDGKDYLVEVPLAK